MKEIQVVAALIYKDNKVLIARRSTGDENVNGKWEFPGGKVEPNETEEHAIEREMNEEFDVIIKANKYLTNNICEYPNRIINLKLYECTYISGKFNLHDHYEYTWIEPSKLLEYTLCPADIPLAKYVMEKKHI